MFQISCFPPSPCQLAGLRRAGKFQERGFTFLEVMVAVLILTIGIVAVLQIFPVGLNVERTSQMTTQGSLLAQEKIEEFTSKAYQDVPVGTETEGSLTSPFEKFSRETKITYVNADLQETGSNTGLKKIEVTVSWLSPLRIGDKEVKLITLIAEK